MELKIFRCLWGVQQIDDAAFAGYKQAGYDGVEYKSLEARKYDSFGAWCKEYDLDFIAQIHTTGNSLDEHLSSFESLIARALPLRPICINSQSGCDYWSSSQKHHFMEAALSIEEKYGVPVAHETHRGRITYTPWDTSTLIDSFPAMHTCCDFSHWVTVCERLLLTENAHIEKTIGAAIHLHARVGYEQGPQVPDPRAPEYTTHLEAHEKWWMQLWKKQKENGLAFSSACPEYGPPLYQHTIPFSGRPVSDVPEITDWAMQRLQSLFQSTIHN
jgi:hypothetical protein